MRSRSDPDRIHVVFHDHRLVANAGLLLPASLALRLGLGELVDRYVDLGDTPAAPAYTRLAQVVLILEVHTPIKQKCNPPRTRSQIKGFPPCHTT